MKLDYERPGDLIIGLEERDFESLELQDYCMTPLGLCGLGTEIWIHNNSILIAPNARIEENSDIQIQMPRDMPKLPARIDRVYMNPDAAGKDRLSHYLGSHGLIIIEAV